MLLATLLSVGGLSRRNEIDGAQGLGRQSPQDPRSRYSRCPFSSVSPTSSIGELVLPPATRQRLLIQETSITRRASQIITTDPVYVDPGRNDVPRAKAQLAHENARRGHGRAVRRGQPPHQRIDAQSAVWEDGTWVFYGGSHRTFTKAGENGHRFERLDPGYSEPMPGELDVRKLEPEEMPYRELRSYIQRLHASGNDARNLAVQLQLKLSFPFVAAHHDAAGRDPRGRGATERLRSVVRRGPYHLVLLLRGASGGPGAWPPGHSGALAGRVGREHHLRRASASGSSSARRSRSRPTASPTGPLNGPHLGSHLPRRQVLHLLRRSACRSPLPSTRA